MSIAFLAAASLLTVGNASAQTGSVQATVPFNFTVGNTELPAGTYTISATSENVIVVRNKDLPRISMLSMTVGDDATSAKGEELVFHKYGEQYFLSELICPAHAVTGYLPTSRREKRAQELEASFGGMSPIYLALK